ncbi:bifunctional glutamate N-acetyltransferase/amino-acid acetyltransferase ArgJ [Alloiococcus sp. CFN-8]|uniref:bifunctional glutamate N-acetyltransferase/amino-acid acetyltransferase ArgJ n=1 Tax=Alloiococcus sp. CFN-8 TaxID=3416081 RepID=UPI003CE7D963
MKLIAGGVCASKGFKASGIHCGIRKNKSKKDLALIVSERMASAAAVYTQNLVKGAPIAVTQKNISDGFGRAIICNSGNANTCNENGIEIAEKMCSLTAEALDIEAEDIIVASTGVIGKALDIEPIKNGMKELCGSLGNKSSEAAKAIMTTDTKEKEVAVAFTIGDKECHIGGIAKGSGMIHPNMATMLVFITSDVYITPELLQKVVSEDVEDSFNMITVDGDTSTNDMLCVLANGAAENKLIACENEDYEIFKKALSFITTTLSKEIAADGEGASKLLECRVKGAYNKHIAKTVAKAVVGSSLVKAAMFGQDANWGRILCAIGYSGAMVDVNKIDVDFSSFKGSIAVCNDGKGVAFSEEKAKKVLSEKEIVINIDLNSGTAEATAWGCDLTYDYVKINGDYRT